MKIGVSYRVVFFVIVLALCIPSCLFLLIRWNGLPIGLGGDDFRFLPQREKWLVEHIGADQLRKDAKHLAHLYNINTESIVTEGIPAGFYFSATIGVDSFDPYVLESIYEPDTFSQGLAVPVHLLTGLHPYSKFRMRSGPLVMASLPPPLALWDTLAPERKQYESRGYITLGMDDGVFEVPESLWSASIRKFKPVRVMVESSELVVITKESSDGEYLTEIRVEYYPRRSDVEILPGVDLSSGNGVGEVKIVDGIHWFWIRTYKNVPRWNPPMPPTSANMESPK